MTTSDSPTPAGEDSTVEAAEIPADAPDAPPEGDDLDPADGKLAAEAAKWRRQARAAEVKQRLAEARVEMLQRNEIRQHLAQKFAQPDDFWLAQPEVTVADLTNDAGEIDADKVHEAADAILAERPFWKATLKPVGAPSSAVTGDGRYDVPASEQPSWETLLKGKTAG